MNFNDQYDVADGHNGSVADFGMTYAHVFGPNLNLSGNVGASIGWGSGAFMQSYFGIDNAAAAASSLAAYHIRASVRDAGLSGMLNYRFVGSWSVGARLGYSRVIGDAADSPIVAKVVSEDQFRAGTFLGFTF